MTKTQSEKREVQNTTSKPRIRSKPSGSSTMEELLATYKPRLLRRGQRIEALVASLSPKQILLDIGGKAEAVVLEREKKILDDLLKMLKVGDKVYATVLDPESEYGYPVVSLRGFRSMRAWDKLRKMKEEDTAIEAEVVTITRGGVLVDVFGVQGFVPISHLASQEEVKKLSEGQKITVKIIELDSASNRLILSQRLASARAADVAKILLQIQIGQTYKGIVSGITKFGIFVMLSDGGGIDFSKASIEGLVHISEISWEKVEEIENLFQVGDEVEVMVIGVDKANQKLNLSLKQLMTDPFATIAKDYAPEKEIKGTVSRISRFGVFVALAGGVEGLIHQSKLPTGTTFEEGDSVTCTVESVDVTKRRIALVPILREKPVGYR